ncbi:MAG: 50S ribosomal protein L10, partial [Christensenellales bacterium]
IKETEKTEIKAGVLEGKVVDVAAVKALASLPSREVLLAKVLGSMNAPITGFVTALSGNIRNLLYVLNAIGEKKSA